MTDAKTLLEGTTLSDAIKRFERAVAAHTRAWDEGDLDRLVRNQELASARADLARQVTQLEAQLAEVREASGDLCDAVERFNGRALYRGALVETHDEWSWGWMVRDGKGRFVEAGDAA